MPRFSVERWKKICEAKDEIKELSQQQRLDKRSLGVDHRKVANSGGLQSSVLQRKARITALHNVYALLREKDHKHGIREYYLWYYEKLFSEYEKKYISCTEQLAAAD